MKRIEIIKTVGEKYLTENIENSEFSYVQALSRKVEGHKFLDIRFESEELSILIETKAGEVDLNNANINQLKKYVELEKEYRPQNKIVSILHNVDTDETLVWKDDKFIQDEKFINSMDYYKKLYSIKKINDKDTVLRTINTLNTELHKVNIKEDLRSQFVGCILVGLNNGLDWDSKLSSKEILSRISDILESKIDDNDNKKIKTKLLIDILKDQNVKKLNYKQLVNILNIVKENLVPFINNNTTKGEDLLNLFFTTFNKYALKKDKNQAFTPTHITEFMAEIANVQYNSKVLDPTCGSGAFLVQAMTKMLSKKEAINNEKIKNSIKTNQLFGIESEETAFGLATTNMVIHEDGKSNVVLDSCFNRSKWIKDSKADIVLMNPPFNAKNMPEDCPVDTKNTDATKGLYFVNYVADLIGKGTIVTILPMQCAIGSDKAVKKYKKLLMSKHTLKAVFTMPADLFHPGAGVDTCVMLIETGKPHDSSKNTYFGYYKDDGFIKKKNMGRIEKKAWEVTKKEWIDNYFDLKERPGFSILKNVTPDSEWLAEAYVETNYDNLSEIDFINSARSYLSYKIKGRGDGYDE